MYAKLTIPERLKDLRVMQKHLTLEELEEQTGLSKSALGKYETDDYKDISPFAIVTLAEFYGVSTDYLLGLAETKNHPNTTLSELHFGDAAIDILKSGKLNNRQFVKSFVMKTLGGCLLIQRFSLIESRKCTPRNLPRS